MDSFSFNAPTGQLIIHCPQLIQSTSPRPLSKIGPTVVLNPLFLNPIALTPWTLLQTLIHLPQRIHLEGSLTIDGELVSTGFTVFSPINSIFLIPISSDSLCNSQFPLLSQEVHSLLWFDKRSSKFTFLASLTLFVFVLITIPSATGKTQDAFKFFCLSTSTRHSLHDPTWLIPSR